MKKKNLYFILAVQFIVLLLTIVGVIVLVLNKKHDPTNYEECAALGNPLPAIYPGVCSYKEKTFVQKMTITPIPPVRED